MKQTLSFRLMVAWVMIWLVGGCNHILPQKWPTWRSVGHAAEVAVTTVIAPIVVVGFAYWIIDPLSPNWSTKTTLLNEDGFYRIDLKTKYLTNGGLGESRLIFKRAADNLLVQEKALHYEIISFEEGIESETLGTYRYASGVIKVHRPAFDQVQAWQDTRR